MKPVTLFPQILLFFSSFLTFTLSDYIWLKVGTSTSGYFDEDDNDDEVYYQISLLAGRTYNIVLLGDDELDTWLNIWDPNDNYSGNDDWEGGGDYDWSAVVNMSPEVDGICTIEAGAYWDGDYYLMVMDTTPCPNSCTSKSFYYLEGLILFEGCQSVSALCSDSLCQSGHSCSSCSGGLIPYGAACVSTCPPGTYLSSGTCKSNPFSFECLLILLACSSLYGSYCLTCDTSSCLSCDSGYAYEGSCVDSCPSGTYTSGGACFGKKNDILSVMMLDCSTLNSYCTSCSSSSSCTACSGSRFIYGSTCVTSCSSGTYNDGTYCRGNGFFEGYFY